MRNLIVERSVDGRYERVEALNDISRRRAVGASERTASRTVFGAIPPAIAATLGSASFRAYEHRSVPFLAATALFVAFCISGAWPLRESPWLLVCAVVGMFFVEDFFSGVLHIVLDDPRNIRSPLFARGALEFQAHHVLPKDIVRKPFFDVLGDLNPIVIGHVVVLGAITQFQYPVVNFLLGTKLLLAWWGQFSHRMAHEAPDKRGRWVEALQSVGLLLRPDSHNLHHTHYDRSFTITSGASNFILDRLHRVLPQRHAWAAIFIALTAFDCLAFAWLLHEVFEPSAGRVWTWTALAAG
ncbi:MAG: hypothetical protein H6744_17720 [Deltaproteobacteria bacterium]|nr:hypothetical protein [Deltaproteobacteria bacterium]